ncbi:MAG: hypothetical protein IT174_00560 [Acidobacteria bacterium]|nr:hypothetical protein [Acidobacteriota bacterium]
MKVFSICCLLFLFSFAAQAQRNTVSINYRLTVDATTPSLKLKAARALEAELASIKDLKRVQDGGGFWLDIKAMEIQNAAGKLIGYVISMAIGDRHSCTGDGASEIISYYDLADHGIILTDDARLPGAAKQIVAVFNQIIDPLRKFTQNLDLNKLPLKNPE